MLRMLDGAFEMIDGCAYLLKKHASALIGSCFGEQRILFCVRLMSFSFLTTVKSSHSTRYLRNVNIEVKRLPLARSKSWRVNPPGWVEVFLRN